MAPAKAKLSSRLHFHDWEQALEQCELAQSRKESWAITLRWYLSWAKRARVPVDFDSARDFIAQVELEKRPSSHRLEQWKEAIRWFFREGKRRGSEGSLKTEHCGLGGEGPAGSDMAQPPGEVMDWRTEAIRVLRVRKYAYRTEQSYLEWLTRFERSVQGRNLHECGAPEVRRFLDDLAVLGKVSASTQRQAFGLVES